LLDREGLIDGRRHCASCTSRRGNSAIKSAVP
jgi:hypothetical protein